MQYRAARRLSSLAPTTTNSFTLPLCKVDTLTPFIASLLNAVSIHVILLGFSHSFYGDRRALPPAIILRHTKEGTPIFLSI
jgi:hypothetical protein